MAGDRAPLAAPVHRALLAPMLVAGAPRAIALVNGTLAAALGLGLRQWLAGLLVLVAGHAIAAWAARKDPQVFEVGARHVRLPTRLEV
jgi:type IV secretion system protein VirB3